MSVRFKVSAAELEEESLTDPPDGIASSSRSQNYGSVNPQIHVDFMNGSQEMGKRIMSSLFVSVTYELCSF
jgi:hypothetical protein